VGFSTVFAGTVVLSLLIASFASMFLLLERAGHASLQGVLASGERSTALQQMALDLETLRVDAETRQALLNVTNSGSARLPDFSKVDLLVAYYSNATNSLKARLMKYGSDWQVIGVVVGDVEIAYQEGRPLFPGEKAVIAFSLPDDADLSKPVEVVIVSPLGKVFEKRFAVNG